MLESPQEIRRLLEREEGELAADARERIFRGAVRRVRRARVRQNVLIASSALVLLGLLVWSYASWRTTGEPAPSVPTITVREADHARALPIAQALNVGEREVELDFAGGAAVRAEPSATLTVAQASPPRIQLAHGRIDANGAISVDAPGC